VAEFVIEAEVPLNTLIVFDSVPIPPATVFNDRKHRTEQEEVMLSRAASRCFNKLPRHVRCYNFASTEYKLCFGGLPIADGVKLRREAIAYLDTFEPESWFADPVTSMVNGKYLTNGNPVPTLDAFERENGVINMATPDEVDEIVKHMQNFEPKRDYRDSVRAMEKDIFDNYSAQLIGNQAVDFRKQDGVTEIEESVQANLVERRMNDLLLQDEDAGRVKICRAPAYVGCVSNFSNFLDLSRKVLRNIELGVPAIVLSRSNTTQHMFRWTQLLVTLMEKHGVDPGLLTYAAFSIKDTHRMFDACREGAMYITCSRAVASSVREAHGNVMSSTGGPNTLVAPAMTDEIRDAIQLSAMIENSGQCTALRHACIAGATDADMELMFNNAPVVTTPQDALRNGAFAGVFDETHPAPFNLVEGYTSHPLHDNIAYRLGEQLPADGIEEQWRQVYVDMTSVEPKQFGTDEQIESLSSWLVRNQPITLAMNTVNADMSYARKLFEQTGQVVYTVGFEGEVALTCQARPQEGEVFGEFPVRRDLAKYTRYPVVVPSPTPAYNCHYEEKYLKKIDKKNGHVAALEEFLPDIESSVVRGFCILLHEYLADACGVNRGDGKNTGGPDRTILYGLQRPPMNGQDTILRCDAYTSFDELAPTLLPFYVTNALPCVRVSCDPKNTDLLSQLKRMSGLQRKVDEQTEAEFSSICDNAELYNVVLPHALADNNNTASLEQFPMVGQFVSLYFPLGHVKSTRRDDEDFANFFSESKKWLKMRA
jgi:hypothetical protein